MNRKIKAYQAIIYIVLFYLAAVLFLLGPGKLLEKDRLLAGAENPVGTVEVREDQQVQQVLIAEGDYLRYLELYVTSPKSSGEYYHLLVYDENNEMLINRDFELKADEVPGFVRIPLGIDTTRGTAYVWQLQGKSEPLELSYENTGETGLTCFGSYYVLADSTSTQMETQNIVMRLVYTDKPSAAVMTIFKTMLCVVAAAFILAAVYLSPKQPKLNNKITWRFVHWVTAGPLITVGTAVLLWEVYGRRAFGGKPDDLIVYGLGIGLFFAFSAWVLFSRRGSKYHPPFEEMLTEQGMDWLQAAAFAGVLLGGIHYMNALYQNQSEPRVSGSAFVGGVSDSDDGISCSSVFQKGRTAGTDRPDRRWNLVCSAVADAEGSPADQRAAWQTDFSGSADRLFLRSDSGRAGSTNPRQKAGRGQCQPHLYGSAVWIYGAFGDFQKYAPLADLSGGRICTLLCFLSGLEQKETPVE